jgi:YHS domain-containing protein
MKTKIALMLVLFLVCVSVVAYAEEAMAPAAPAVSASTEQVTDVGNKFCPVSGDKVSGQSFVTYQGKRYGMCCPMCEQAFLADPAKYIAKTMEQERAAVQGG